MVGDVALGDWIVVRVRLDPLHAPVAAGGVDDVQRPLHARHGLVPRIGAAEVSHHAAQVVDHERAQVEVVSDRLLRHLAAEKQRCATQERHVSRVLLQTLHDRAEHQVLARVVLERGVVVLLDRHGLDELDDLHAIQVLQSALKLSARVFLAVEIETIDLEGQWDVHDQAAEHVVGRPGNGRFAERKLEIDREPGGVLDRAPHQVEAANAIGTIDLDRADLSLAVIVDVALGLRRADVVGQRHQVDLARGVVVREDRQRPDEGAFGKRRLVGFAVSEQQEVQAGGVQPATQPRPIGRVVHSIGLAMTFGFEQEWMQDALELRLVTGHPRRTGRRCRRGGLRSRVRGHVRVSGCQNRGCLVNLGSQRQALFPLVRRGRRDQSGRNDGRAENEGDNGSSQPVLREHRGRFYVAHPLVRPTNHRACGQRPGLPIVGCASSSPAGKGRAGTATRGDPASD